MSDPSPADLYLHSLSLASDIIRNILAIIRVELGRVYLAVDAGCGPGTYVKPLLSILDHGGRVIAIDSSQEMLDTLRSRLQPTHLRRVILLHERLEDMDKFVCDANLVLCASSLQFTNLVDAFAAIYSSLARNGVLIFSMPMGLAGVLEEAPVGAYGAFQAIFHDYLRDEVSKHAQDYPLNKVAAPRPDRALSDFLTPCREAGFVDTHIYFALQIVPASKLGSHLSVPWRAERLIPGLEHRIRQDCIRHAVDRSIRQMQLDKTFPFPRNISYVVAKKALVR
jgi:SAM-dependent methyltransferase